MKLPDGFSLEVPDFFTGDDTAAALASFEAALEANVLDSRLRRSLSSADAAQAIQVSLYIVGSFALNLLGNAGWAAIQKVYASLRGRYGDRSLSIELVAQDDEGHNAEYQLEGASDAALRAIPADLARDVKGVRVQYDVDEGWLTWEEASAKRRAGGGS